MVLPSAHGRSPLWMYHASSLMFLNRPEAVIEHGCNTVLYIHVELLLVAALELVMVSISTRTLGLLRGSVGVCVESLRMSGGQLEA